MAMKLATGILLTLVCALNCNQATVAWGDVFAKKAVAQAPAGENPRKKQNHLAGVTPEREAAVMTFVKQHHPDLVDLLRNLKQTDQKSYGRAIRDLFLVSERLARAQERDSERYEIELQTWKVKSRQQYLTAQIKMSDSPQLREQLRRALEEQTELQILLLELENKRLSQRIQQVQKNIARLQETKEKSVERKFKQIVHGRPSKDAANPSQTPVKRPAKGSPKASPKGTPKGTPKKSPP